MNKYIYIALVVVACVLLVVLFFYKTPKTGVENLNENIVSSIVPSKAVPEFRPTQVFQGVIDGKSAIFEHQDYTKYRLTINGVVTLGNLNTERGYGSDENATVFVLNWDKPEAEQRYFVIKSGNLKNLIGLDSSRKEVSQNLLILVESKG